MPEPLLRFAPFQHTTHVFSVAELAARLGALFETDPVLQDVWLRGEIVNASRSPAGHHYFTLKDDAAQLRCVLFRGSAFNSPVKPTSGLAVVVHGVVRLYERQGSCELVADLVFPEGVGLAQMQGERIYRQLEAEGLFATNRKRPVPAFPRAVGVLSSERGAVIHDVLSVLARRYPLVEVVFVPAPVQGPGAVTALVHGLTRLAQWRRAGRGLDAIIVARGGGSQDDLAAFNDERLVRAMFASPVPVISAVGHETNLTLADLVADLRAPTPSAAAELVAPDLSVIRRDVAALRSRARAALLNLFARQRAAVLEARADLTRMLVSRLDRDRERVNHLAARLRALSPDATLSRGYAIVSAEGHVVDDAATLQPGAHISIRLHRGRLLSTVDAVEPEG